MNAALLVFLGGGLGSLARHGIGMWIGPPASGSFPWSVFSVNVLGSLILGAIAGFASQRELSDATRSFVAIGVLGGFTTYSSFNQETLNLFDERGALVAGGYVLAMVAACLAAGWCGGWILRRALA